MSVYKTLSIVQFFFILLCGISVLDFGVELNQDISANGQDPEGSTGLGFNELIFGDNNADFWGAIQFWGYCMIIVAILQLLKALSVDSL